MVFLLFFNVKIGHIGALNCCIHFHLNILQKKMLYTDHISYIGYVIGYGFVCRFCFYSMIGVNIIIM